MKKHLLYAPLLLLALTAKSQAPSGLDSIIVEKYYISDLNDKTVDAVGGVLPLGSTTYRIYVDMKPGFKFQAAYGIDLQPVGTRNPGDHELRISTTTLFFNNEDRGAINPTFTKTQAKNNTVMLDSWLSVGAACSGNFGVLKADDNGSATVVNVDGVLQNNDPLAGIPLTTEDGLLVGTPEPVTMVGITTEAAVFDAQNDGTNGPLFSTFNGSWASLNGSTGPTPDNKVLIAQITTDGVLCFELNIQLGTSTGGVENWVANSPITGEATHPSLSYCSTVGIKDEKSADSYFTTYPNPTNNMLTIDIAKNSDNKNNSYTVLSIDGKVIESKIIGAVQGQHKENINLSNVAPGLYFIQLNIDNKITTKKIIKN